MKIAIISKPGTIMNWAEDAEQDFLLAGHDVRFIATRHRYLTPYFNNIIYSDSLGKIRASFIISALKQFKPDVIIAFGAYQIPPIVLESIASMPDRAPFVGWVGIKFSDAHARLAAHFDLIGYADTGLIKQHKERGLTTEIILLPLAARASDQHRPMARTDTMVFVGGPNPHRRAVLNAIKSPVDIYGPRWNKMPMAPQHQLHSYRISPRKVQDLYRSRRLTLNMKSDAYNIDGLNQRHFAPYPYGCAVVAEYMKDIERFFDKDKEMFVWSTLDQLNELCEALANDPARIEAVAHAGQKRVLCEHLYRHRLGAIMQHLN